MPPCGQFRPTYEWTPTRQSGTLIEPFGDHSPYDEGQISLPPRQPRVQGYSMVSVDRSKRVLQAILTAYPDNGVVLGIGMWGVGELRS